MWLLRAQANMGQDALSSKKERCGPSRRAIRDSAVVTSAEEARLQDREVCELRSGELHLQDSEAGDLNVVEAQLQYCEVGGLNGGEAQLQDREAGELHAGEARLQDREVGELQVARLSLKTFQCYVSATDSYPQRTDADMS